MKPNHFNAWIRVAWFSLIAVTLLGTSRHSIVAQSQEPQKPAPEGRRENFLDGFHSDDFRIQFSFKYNFSKKFAF